MICYISMFAVVALLVCCAAQHIYIKSLEVENRWIRSKVRVSCGDCEHCEHILEVID